MAYQRNLSNIWKCLSYLFDARISKIWMKLKLNLSIGDWVLYKRGSDGDDSYLEFIIRFRKKIFIFLNFITWKFLQSFYQIWTLKYVRKTYSNVGNNLSIISWHHKPIVREIPRSVGFNLRMHIQDWQGYQKIRQTWNNRKKMISIQNWIIMVLGKANLKWIKYAPCLFSYAVVI